MGRAYTLISADSHINEPPHLYVDRVPAKYRDRAPRMERLPQGDAWIIEGAKDPINFGMNAVAGLPYEKTSAWVRWEDIRPGGYDPAARLIEQDQDRVDAEIMYPTPRISGGVFYNRSDPELHNCLIRAYNDWLAEYCSYAPDRLIGIAEIPSVGIDSAVAELERAAKLPGMRGVVLAAYPNGGYDVTEEDDRFWAICQELGWPVSLHVGFTTEAPGAHTTKLPGDVRFYDVPTRIMQLIFAEVFERFPRLAVELVEVDCGWIPYFREQLDDRYKRIHHYANLHLPKLPSEYFNSNFYYTYITDHYGVKNRHEIGVDKIMWSSDYPHIGADWPNSWDTIERDFAGVPEEEKHLILAGNAARLYGLV
ncbi:MAG TPA: amidohydrolase family protein [Dehalococcoidia bacterium]|nr:amidohydrolase family protein [Dehalococcoidia bacterium]